MSADHLSESPEERETTPLVICRNCTAIGYFDDRYCASCGVLHRLSGVGGPLRCCRECGAAIRHRLAFHCTQCGRSLLPDDGEG